MAVVTFYDALGAGVDMRNPDFTYVENGGDWWLDGAPYVTDIDWETAAFTYSFNDGAIYATTVESEIADPWYLVESVYYSDEFFGALADFEFVDVPYNAWDLPFGELTFANMLSGDDDIAGTRFSDHLRGFAGDDLLSGLNGNDTLDGGSGWDDLYGDAGNDVYLVDSRYDRVFETPTASSTVDSGGIDEVRSSVTYALGLHVEDLVLTGTLAVQGTGNALANAIAGNAAANVLRGLAGSDTVAGGGGGDTLVGGFGRDRLAGGAGADLFDFNAYGESGAGATTRDTIVDFRRGVDRIDLSTLDANTANGAGTNEAFTGFVSASAAFTAPGQLKFVAGVLYANSDTDAAAEFSVAVTGVAGLGTGDLVL